jgi:predicted nucleic acid-binding protein
MPEAADIPVYQLDANVLLRFLRNDHREFSPRAQALVQGANDGRAILEVSAVTVAEVFYALRASYGVGRRLAARTLAEMLTAPAFRVAERDRVLDALQRVQAANVDFGDAYLAATAAENGGKIMSFDRDLDKFADVKRVEP